MNIKYNLYIKKYYGSVGLYECPYILNNYSNVGLILSKPINNLKEKKIIFNKLIQLERNQLITGYYLKILYWIYISKKMIIIQIYI